jgi:hypothetical protein
VETADPKNAATAERLREIKAELAGVREAIRDLSRAVEKPEHAGEVLGRLRERLETPRTGASRGAGTPAEAAASPTGGEPGLRRGADDPTQAAPEAAGGRSRAAAGAAPAPDRQEDRRLASYLVTGSFHSVHPLRQERRVLRNKAILMIVFLLILLFLIIRAIAY